LKAKITIVREDEKEAKAIGRAVYPDNVGSPKFSMIKTLVKGKTIKFEMRFKGRPETFIATIDDLLLCTQMAEKALEAVKIAGKR
jgi:hypothetical protein